MFKSLKEKIEQMNDLLFKRDILEGQIEMVERVPWETDCGSSEYIQKKIRKIDKRIRKLG